MKTKLLLGFLAVFATGCKTTEPPVVVSIGLVSGVLTGIHFPNKGTEKPTHCEITVETAAGTQVRVSSKQMDACMSVITVLGNYVAIRYTQFEKLDGLGTDKILTAIIERNSTANQVQ